MRQPCASALRISSSRTPVGSLAPLRGLHRSVVDLCCREGSTELGRREGISSLKLLPAAVAVSQLHTRVTSFRSVVSKLALRESRSEAKLKPQLATNGLGKTTETVSCYSRLWASVPKQKTSSCGHSNFMQRLSGDELTSVTSGIELFVLSLLCRSCHGTASTLTTQDCLRWSPLHFL